MIICASPIAGAAIDPNAQFTQEQEGSKLGIYLILCRREIISNKKTTGKKKEFAVQDSPEVKMPSPNFSRSPWSAKSFFRQ
jgi:hypothetical protein